MTNIQQAQTQQDELAPSRGAVFGDILCAVDGTRSSMGAVRQAAILAGPSGHLTLLAVTAVSGAGQYATAAISPRRVEHVLEHAAGIAEEFGVGCSSVVDPGGPPVDVIIERAAEHDLLAIGAPATSWLGGMLIGSVASRTLGRFTTPLLVARRSFTESLQGRHIVIASDGLEGSDQIAELAGRLGFSTGASVTLLHAVGVESLVSTRAIEAQERMLEQSVPGAIDVRIEARKPAEAILEAAHNPDVALVLMGSRRRGGLRSFGSVSRKVAHDAACSVLLIPPCEA